jgi:hypothetical protein
MTIAIEEANFYLFSEKTIIDPRPWELKKSRDGVDAILEFVSRVKVGDSMPRGLWLRITILPNYGDVVTFQLELEKPGERTRMVLYRLELNPISGHQNGGDERCPAELRHLIFQPGQTHDHCCLDFVSLESSTLVVLGVRAARLIDPNFANYSNAFTFVCDKLKIVNGLDVPAQNVQLDMLLAK